MQQKHLVKTVRSQKQQNMCPLVARKINQRESRAVQQLTPEGGSSAALRETAALNLKEEEEVHKSFPG